MPTHYCIIQWGIGFQNKIRSFCLNKSGPLPCSFIFISRKCMNKVTLLTTTKNFVPTATSSCFLCCHFNIYLTRLLYTLNLPALSVYTAWRHALIMRLDISALLGVVAMGFPGKLLDQIKQFFLENDFYC